MRVIVTNFPTFIKIVLIVLILERLSQSLWKVILCNKGTTYNNVPITIYNNKYPSKCLNKYLMESSHLG